MILIQVYIVQNKRDFRRTREYMKVDILVTKIKKKIVSKTHIIAR